MESFWLVRAEVAATYEPLGIADDSTRQVKVFIPHEILTSC